MIQSGVAGAGALAAYLARPGSDRCHVARGLAAAQEDDRGILIMRGSGATMPENFNPLLNDVRVWLYDGLVRFDEEMNPIPDLAESWEISEDGTVYTIKLREDVKFHDGTPMTADDVLYTAELTLDENDQLALPQQVHHRRRAGRLGEGRRLHGAGDPAEAVRPLPRQALPRRRDLLLHPAEAHPRSSAPDMRPATSTCSRSAPGPTSSSSTYPDQRLVHGGPRRLPPGPPGVKQVVRLAYPERAIGAGGAEVGRDRRHRRCARRATSKRPRRTANLTVHRYDSNWIFAGRMNMANPILQDKAVREAIAHAIDRENLVKAAVSPTATVGNSPISIGWAASPDVPVFDYDPEKAKSAARGGGLDGRRHPPEGRRSRSASPSRSTRTTPRPISPPGCSSSCSRSASS